MTTNSGFEIFAFDIETNGCLIGTNELIAVGYVFGDANGNINEKGRIEFKVETEFEPRCYEEFWKTRMELYNELQKNALPAKEATALLASIIDEHEKKNPIRPITDFAAFDTNWINFYFAKYLDRKPLHYTHDGKFRPIYDTDSYARGVTMMDYSNPWVNDEELIKKHDLEIKAKKDHYPENDAEYIYELHIKLVNIFSKK